MANRNQHKPLSRNPEQLHTEPSPRNARRHALNDPRQKAPKKIACPIKTKPIQTAILRSHQPEDKESRNHQPKKKLQGPSVSISFI